MFQTLLRKLKFPKSRVKEILDTTVQHNLNPSVEMNDQAQWEQKMKFWFRKYEDLFGITKLSEMHERVLKTQQSIQIVQEERRKIQQEIFIAQKKLDESRDILHKSRVGDDNYISVVTQVQELLKEQRRLQDAFSFYDQTEREQWTTLALAINTSQDHERTYREKNKYLSLITGVVGGLLGLIASSIHNWHHRKDVKLISSYCSNISDQVTVLQENVEKLNSEISSSGNSTLHEGDSNQAENFLSQMKTQQELFQNNVKALQSLVSNSLISDCEANNEFYLDLQFKKRLNQLEENVLSKLNDHMSLNIGVIGSLFLFGTLLLYMINTR